MVCHSCDIRSSCVELCSDVVNRLRVRSEGHLSSGRFYEVGKGVDWGDSGDTGWRLVYNLLKSGMSADEVGYHVPISLRAIRYIKDIDISLGTDSHILGMYESGIAVKDLYYLFNYSKQYIRNVLGGLGKLILDLEGMSVSDIARELGCSRTSIYEHGVKSVKLRDRIVNMEGGSTEVARKLGCSVRYVQKVRQRMKSCSE